MIRNPIVTAGLKCAIEIFPNMYTAIAIPTKGANALNEIPNIPCILESKTTAPVAHTTTINVPMTSAMNFC